MEDAQIVDLYWEREERAVAETEKKYGVFCHYIAKNILSQEEDAQECVNETYFRAWDSIPPQRPERLGAWLGRVVRNISINLWNKNHARKRYAGMEQLLGELDECLPAADDVEKEWEGRELTRALDEWLGSLSFEDRNLFLRRYWYGEAVNTLAPEYGMSPSQMAKKMYRLRQDLRALLERKGYAV